MPEHAYTDSQLIPTNKVKTQIEPGRADASDDTLDSMILSIEQIGLLHPITVTPEGEDFRCLAGNRRLAACRALEWEHIPAKIIDEPTERQQIAIPALENLERRQLDPWQEAQMCKAALSLEPDLDNLAKLIHRSRNWIESRLALLTWPQEALDALRSGALSMSAIAPLATIPDQGARSFYLEQATASGANTRTTALWASAWKADWQTDRLPPNGPLKTPETPPVRQKPPTGVCLSCGQNHNLNELSHMPICPPCLGVIKAATAQAPADPQSDAAAAAASDTDG